MNSFQASNNTSNSTIVGELDQLMLVLEIDALSFSDVLSSSAIDMGLGMGASDSLVVTRSKQTTEQKSRCQDVNNRLQTNQVDCQRKKRSGVRRGQVASR